MEICFRSSGVFAVKAERKEERLRLFDAVEKRGLPVRERWRETDFTWPRDSCLFAVDLRRKRMEYMAEPHICAAMVSSGVRICCDSGAPIPDAIERIERIVEALTAACAGM